MIGLAAPLALLALPLPALVWRFAPQARPAGAALAVPEALGRRLPVAPMSTQGRWADRAIALLAWILLVVALAGPRQLAPTAALPVSGRDMILALDLSGSMVREDFAFDGETLSRLDAVKRVGTAFVRGRSGDRVGLVVFGSEAYVAAAPSFDVAAVAGILDVAEIGISGRATNITDGLGLALRRLERSDARERVVILLSDGANNAGSAPPEAAP